MTAHGEKETALEEDGCAHRGEESTPPFELHVRQSRALRPERTRIPAPQGGEHCASLRLRCPGVVCTGRLGPLAHEH